MNEADSHTQQLSSTALVQTTTENPNNGVVNAGPTPRSARALTCELFRHAVYTAFLAVQLFILPLKRLVWHFVPYVYKRSQGQSVFGSILKRTNTLHPRWLLRWPFLRSLSSAWSRISAIPHRIDHVAALLEQNIELMSLKRLNEEGNAPSKTREECLSNDETMISPITASAIYHAALANNQTLDNLLDNFDGGKASTMYCPSIDEQIEMRARDSSGIWAKTASLSKSALSLPTEQPGRSNVSFSKTSDTGSLRQFGNSADIPPSTPEIARAALLRHRSPVPSVSTTTPQSSQSTTSSFRSGHLASRPMTEVSSRHESTTGLQARCTACGRGHTDVGHERDSEKESKCIETQSAHGLILRNRHSAIPRRKTGLVVNHRARIRI